MLPHKTALPSQNFSHPSTIVNPRRISRFATIVWASAFYFMASVLTVQAAPTLSVGSASGASGSTVDIPVTFNPGGTSVASLQLDITMPAGTSTGSIATGSILTAAGKSVTGNRVGNTWKFVIFGLNQNTIAAGVAFTPQFVLAPSATGTLNLAISGVAYSDPDGQSITAGASTGGTITVTAATPPAPVVTSAGSATGTVGSAFSYQITASNSPTSFNATGLPAGLTRNTTTGLISGTPTAAGTSSISLSATNAGGTGTKTLSLTVNAVVPPPVVSSPTLGVGSVTGAAGSSVNLPITFNTGSEDVAALQFSLTLPSGLSTGTVTPGAILTAAGKSVSANRTGNTWTFVVFGLNQNTIASGSLATAQLNIALSASGTLNIPITAVTYSDADGQAIPGGASSGGTITVTAAPPSAPVINSAVSATGTVGSAFSYQITATNSPTSFNATGLPSGLTRNTTTGLISGTPTAAGTSSISLSATNAGGTGNQTLSLTVNAVVPPVVSSPTLAVGSVTGAAGSSVNLPVTFNTGSAAVTGIQFSLTLPSNLSTGTVTPGAILTAAGKSVSANRTGNTWTFIIFGLNQNAIASGSLVTAQLNIALSATGTLNLPISGVSYSDENGQAIPAGASTAGSITVTAAPPTAPVITSAGSATGTVGSAFSYQITASNSPTSFNATGLPAGLTRNTTTGLISGTPTAAGTSSISLSATNAGGTGTQTLSLTVNAVTPPSVSSPTLAAGSVTGAAGSTVDLPITFNTGSKSVTAIQFSLTLPSSLSTGTVTPGAILTAAGKSVSANRSGNLWTFVIFGLNQNTINSGTLVTAQLNIASGATGVLSLPISNVSYSDADGQSLVAGPSTAGTVTVTGTVPSAPVITSAGSATGTVGAAFSYQITASNSPTSFNATGLPAGLTRNTTTGLISGTPTASGTSSISLSATNATGTGTKTLTLTVNPSTPPPPPPSGSPTLTGAAASGAAGSLVNIPISFNPGAGSVTGIQFSLTLPASLSTGTITAGPIVTAAGKSISANKSGSVWTFIVFGLNQTAIASGNLVTVQMRIAAGTAAATLSLPMSNVSYTDGAGVPIPAGTSTGLTVTVTGGGSVNLPTPTLDWPDYMPVNGTMIAGYPSGYDNLTFEWSISRVGDITSIGAPANRVVAPASSANFQTTSRVAPLAAYSLTPGLYQASVRVRDGNNNVSASAVRTVNLVMADFSNVRVYPNPWRADKHMPHVTFDRLPLNSTVKIFTVSGHWVQTLTPNIDIATWDLMNSKGDKVASGIYLYLITTSESSEKSKGQIVVIR